MVQSSPKDGKQRILEAAISLFSKRGFDAVGVREIAKEANVNISMISYYFEGKIGILKAIMNDFHDRYYQMIKNVMDDSLPLEECVGRIIRNLVTFIRTHTDLTMIVLHSLPLDIPEIVKLKANKISKLITELSGLFKRFGLDPDDKVLFSIVGPSLVSSILAHFRFKSVQKNVLNIDFDDEFYEKYTETLTTLFLNGLNGLAVKKPEIGRS
ncbi:hypothetical protein B6I21_04435 [candidate division KSB1 bacterium 4572_119]|nr:MAG: hypothetical protein B6I21_04435 [candidate division KSB1 bacterium 4572_119]